jgi:large subunit ribosomal protein L23
MKNKTLVRPVITEKSMSKVARGWYTFMADEFATKGQIAQLVKDIYGVTVLEVRTISMHGKSRRAGRSQKHIMQPDWTKAIVHIAEGQTIDAFALGAGEEMTQGK